MNLKLRWFLSFFLPALLLINGCQGGDVKNTTPTVQATSTLTRPASTLIPTTTIFPTITPDAKVETVKQVLIEYGIYGGQSGEVNLMDFFLGRDLPLLVVYSDGQIITFRNGSLLKGQLSASELCLLLADIQKTGFLNAESYSDTTPGFNRDSLTIIFRLNGPQTKLLYIPQKNRPLISKPVADLLDLIEGYRINQPSVYVPQSLMLWVETVDADRVEGQKVTPWPPALPAINQIWKDHTRQQVFLQGEVTHEIIKLFAYQLQALYFSEGSDFYRIVARPLLPHETSQQFSAIPDQVQTFTLPLICEPVPAYLPVQARETPSPAPVSTSVSPEHPELTGLGRILFTSDRSGNQQIFMMDSNGSRQTRITNDLKNDHSAAWSPDGQQVVFISNRDGNDEIYIMNANGTNQKRITHTFDDEAAPDWSMDGRRLVYTRRCNTMDNCTGYQNLYVIDTDGNNARQLTNIHYNTFMPDWSFDGTFVSFVLGDKQGSSIYIIDAAGGEIRPLVDSPKINVTMPSWSPDGSRLAYIQWDTATYISDLYVADADGRNPQRLTREEAVLSEPAWSPDGNWLAFSKRSKDQPGEHIWVIPATKGTGFNKALQLTSGNYTDTKPAWGK